MIHKSKLWRMILLNKLLINSLMSKLENIMVKVTRTTVGLFRLKISITNVTKLGHQWTKGYLRIPRVDQNNENEHINGQILKTYLSVLWSSSLTSFSCLCSSSPSFSPWTNTAPPQLPPSLSPVIYWWGGGLWNNDTGRDHWTSGTNHRRVFPSLIHHHIIIIKHGSNLAARPPFNQGGSLCWTRSVIGLSRLSPQVLRGVLDLPPDESTEH